MRVLLLILALANLAIFVWQAGYLGDLRRGHEPERLRRQIDPESVHILPADQAGLRACRRVGGLDAAQAQALQQVFGSRRGVKLDLVAIGVSEQLIVIGGLANVAAVTKKQAELRALGVADTQVIEGGETGPYAVLLASFRDEVAAKRRLEELSAKGVRSARLQLRMRENAEQEARVVISGRQAESLLQQLQQWALERPNLLLSSERDCPQ